MGARPRRPPGRRRRSRRRSGAVPRAAPTRSGVRFLTGSVPLVAAPKLTRPGWRHRAALRLQRRRPRAGRGVPMAATGSTRRRRPSGRRWCPTCGSRVPGDLSDRVVADLPAWLQVGSVQVAFGRTVGNEAGTSQVPQALVERLGEDVVLGGRPLRGSGQVVGERVGGAVAAEADVAPPQLRLSQVGYPPCHQGEPGGGRIRGVHRTSFGGVPASRTVGAAGPTPSPTAGEPYVASAR